MSQINSNDYDDILPGLKADFFVKSRKSGQTVASEAFDSELAGKLTEISD